MDLLWWHWIILGIVLIAGEVIIPGAVVVWFGMAALIIGGLVYLFALQSAAQFFLWSALSIAMLFAYRRFFKPTAPVTSVGQSKSEYADIPGIVIQQLDDNRFKARFDLPVLGDREWVVESDNNTPLSVGDTVKVSCVHGQIIKVKGA